jgi:hypothetical protein
VQFDIADWPSPKRTRPRQTCFLSSQMNAIGEFSAPQNGFHSGYPAKNAQPTKEGESEARFEWDL